MQTQYIQISTTTDKKEEAERIAEALVDQHLAACVQIIGPMTSIYRWRGKIENTTEWICQIKTTRAMFDMVENVIISIHSYEVPEIIAVPIVNGSANYLQWMDDSLIESN
jgi:periplasmic divalent cation tolerance protein